MQIKLAKAIVRIYAVGMDSGTWIRLTMSPCDISPTKTMT